MDSGWIDCDNVTSIIGVNEAGKSNLLLALWKLHPARDGKIDLLADLPRGLYSDLRDSCQDIQFIEAIFDITEDPLLKTLIGLTGASSEELQTISLSRRYDGKYIYVFPDERKIDFLDSITLKDFIDEGLGKIKAIDPNQPTERKYKNSVATSLENILIELDPQPQIDNTFLENILTGISINTKPTVKSEIAPILEEIIDEIKSQLEILNKKPIKSDDVWAAVFKAIPKFVYFSSYGNLDSEIYLPHVVENLNRTDITGVAAAKARTLRVLFDFIKLDPKEILELGADAPLDAAGQVILNPTDDQKKEYAAKKSERTI
jgi:hypothetical protein